MRKRLKYVRVILGRSSSAVPPGGHQGHVLILGCPSEAVNEGPGPAPNAGGRGQPSSPTDQARLEGAAQIHVPRQDADGEAVLATRLTADAALVDPATAL